VAKWVVVGDSSIDNEPLRTSAYAYPDFGRIDHVLCSDDGHCDEASCGNYSLASTCSPLSTCFGGDGKYATDANLRKKQARHMGGTNLGFADGHAKWFDSEAVLTGSEWNYSGYGSSTPFLQGLEVCFCPDAENKYR
jgi:prepilin-type processing-associated H-X9-DG protein